MDEKLKSIFWNEQYYMKTLKDKSYILKSKAFILTMIPSYITYYHFYESKIRRHSFLIQLIIIYNIYKLSLYTLVSYEITKKIDEQIEKSEETQNN